MTHDQSQPAAPDESMPLRPGARPRTSLRMALAWLFATLFLPLLLLGTALLVYLWNQQRDIAVEQLRHQAENLRIAVEREAALDQAVLNTLASSPNFDDRNWPALHDAARLAAKNRQGSWILVAGSGMDRIFNTRVPYGAPMPALRESPTQAGEVEWNGRLLPLPPPSLVEMPLKTGQPSFSGLIYGPVVRGPVVAITVPVVREGRPRYALSLAYTPDFFVRMLKAQTVADGLLRVIFDRDGVIIARSVGAETFVGRRVAPPFDRGLGNLPPNGGGEGVNLEGVPVFYAYSRSEVNGWVAAVATPRDAVLAPARRALWVWLAILLTTGLVGAFGVVRLWRRLALPLLALATRARTPDAVPPPGPPPTIEEIAVLQQSIDEAAHHDRVRRKAERDLERAEQRLRLVVESSPTGILMVDERGAIRLVNRCVEDDFGYPRDELIGQSVEMLVPQALRSGHAGQVARYFSAPEARAMGAGRNLFGRRKDGSELPIEIGLVPLETGEGPFVLASIVDITERKRAEDELRRSNHDLEQFAYIASHDLQEPLRMVANYTELLAQRYRGRLDEKADKYIHFAVDGAKRMQGLITDLLVYSRVGSRAKPLLPVAARATVAYVLKMMQSAVGASGAHIDVGALPTVLADEGQLTQVFQNLIGNALKFRSERAPQITISARREDGMWRFSVADNGIGFEPQYGERIFLMFQRLHERGRFDGSGIGLAIVKRIVDRHGGHIWAESQPGEGSTFHFTLRPAPEGADESEAAASPATPAAGTPH